MKQETCRVCLAKCFKSQSLFSTYENEYLPQIVYTLTQIVVTEDDGYPSIICYNCADLLLQAEHIRKLCISSDRYFKKQEINKGGGVMFTQNSGENDSVILEDKNESKSVSKSSNTLKYNPVEIVQKEYTKNIESYTYVTPNDNPIIYLEDKNESENDTIKNENLDINKYLSESESESTSNSTLNNTPVEIEPIFPELYMCAICSKKFTTRKAFKRHQRYHPSDKSKCVICREEIDIDSINDHIVDHNEKHELTCVECKSSFLDMTDLLNHIIAVHKTNQNTSVNQLNQRYVYECDFCDHKTVSLVSHRNHTQRKHDMDDPRPIKCSHCTQRFSRKAIFQRHYNIFHNEKIQKLACPICDRKFNIKGNLEIHMRSHTGERPYKCKYCDKRFPQTSSLKRHTFTHTGETPYLCSICGKGFKQINHFLYHQNIHFDKRPHNCEICDRAFRSKTALNTHRKIHLKKNFCCHLCDREFTMQCILNKHLKNRHNILSHQSEVLEEIEVV